MVKTYASTSHVQQLREHFRQSDPKAYEQWLKILNTSIPNKSKLTDWKQSELVQFALNYHQTLPVLTSQILLRSIQIDPSSVETQVALALLADLTQHRYTYQTQLQQALGSTEFPHFTSIIGSFVAYQKNHYTLTLGYYDWSDQELENIHTNSYWGELYKYWSSISAMSVHKTRFSEKALAHIARKSQFSSIKTLSLRQLARRAFHNKQYTKAYKFFLLARPLDVRDLSLWLQEIAWTSYYLKNYSRALGFIRSMHASDTVDIRPFDTYTLQASIYRDLCHYDELAALTSYFINHYEPIEKQIEARQSLAQIPALAKRAMASGEVRDTSNLISQIIHEQELIRQKTVKNLTSNDLVEVAFNELQEIKTRIKKQVELNLTPILQQVSDDFLSTLEQMRFLKFSVQLSSYNLSGLKENTKQQYNLNLKQLQKHNRQIIWPQTNETWLDERFRYQGLISDKCYAGQALTHYGGPNE